MAFLLFQQRAGTPPALEHLVRPGRLADTGLSCPRTVQWASHGFRLCVANPDMACRLPLSQGIADGHPRDDELWLALDGYLDPLPDTAPGGLSLASGPAAGTATNPAWAIARLLAAHGPQALDRLRGNFVLCALWPRRGRWLLYRDPLGGRHACHCSWQGGGTADADSAWRGAASSASALASLRGWRFAAEPAFLASVLALRTPPPVGLTAFRGIAELPAGALLQADNDTVRLQPATIRPPAVTQISATDAIERLADTFQQAVQRTLAEALAGGDDVAVMLSGGMDSSPVAAVAAEILAGHGRLVPVSWSLPGHPEADETAWIDLTCRHLDLQPLRFDGSGHLPFSRLDSSAINPEVPHFNVYRGIVDQCYQLAAQAGCRIVLNGNAGDMIHPPPSLRLVDMAQRRQWRQLWQALRHLHRRCGLRGTLRQPELLRLLLPLTGIGRRSRPPPWLTAVGRTHLQPELPMPPAVASHPCPEHAWQLLGPRMAFGRAQENVAARRHGVDRRDPFHDLDLAELMVSLPAHLSLGLHQDKRLMRAAMRGRLPEPVRRKGRTGLLHGFMAEGFRRHRDDLRQLLRGDDAWQELVEPTAVWPLLSGQTATPTEQLLVGQCAGLVLWHQHWRE